MRDQEPLQDDRLSRLADALKEKRLNRLVGKILKMMLEARRWDQKEMADRHADHGFAPPKSSTMSTMIGGQHDLRLSTLVRTLVVLGYDLCDLQRELDAFLGIYADDILDDEQVADLALRERKLVEGRHRQLAKRELRGVGLRRIEEMIERIEALEAEVAELRRTT